MPTTENKHTKLTRRLLVRKRNISTVLPPSVGEIQCLQLRVDSIGVVSTTGPHAR
jgi:hypothetical protein